MSKRQFKSQASSSRAGSGVGFGGFGSASTSSTLSYLTEPPNFSSISDANVVVGFKNLSKKDGTTKSKALEDLRSYVQAHPFEQGGGTEEPILEAWVKFYPRISIDNSRRVRELSHNLQFELLKSARKRIEKYIPKVVGSWLAGTYDRDRAVARAAKDGIASFLDSEDKVTLFWKRCQVQILEYAQEAINETPQTLSDERTMSADDVQAKYFRVVGSSMSLVLNLLIKLSKDDILKHQDKYDEFLLNNKRLWALAASEDSFARRLVDQLLIVCTSKQATVIEVDLELISQVFISDALRASQSSSAFQLLQTLNTLTAKYPQAWTSSYKGKKAPLSRLRGFVEKGSQGGPPEFWQALRSLLVSLPDGVLPSDLDASVEFLKAIRNGIASREEPRNNAEQAWSSYFEISRLIASKSSESVINGKLWQEAVYPVFEQYLHPATGNSRWAVGSTTALAKAYLICDTTKDTETQISLESEWSRLAEEFMARLQASLPEQSKDYHKSQASIIAEGHRWFGLLGEIIRAKQQAALTDYVGSPSSKIIIIALKSMVSRNGKPYSTAATIEAALRLSPKLTDDPAVLAPIKTTLEINLLTLIFSPSWQYLVSILFLLRSLPDQKAFFENLWQSTTDGLLAVPVVPNKSTIIAALIANDVVASLAQANAALQDFLFDSYMRAINGDSKAWSLLEAAITFNSLTEVSTDELLHQVLDHLDINEATLDGALTVLELISRKKPLLLRTHNTHVILITKLLALTELSDSGLVLRATTLRSVIENSSKAPGLAELGQTPILHIIRENLETASPRSLTIETLIQQAKTVMEYSSDPATIASLFPETTQWTKALAPLLDHPPNPALAVMRPFAGAVFLVDHTPLQPITRPSRDMNGYSVALRMAIYTASLASEKKFTFLSRNVQAEMLYLLYLTAELASDQIDLLEDNKLFESQQDPEIVDKVREFLAQSKDCLVTIISGARSWRRNLEDATVDAHGSSAMMHELIFKLIGASNARSPAAYYSAKALGHIVPKLVDAHGWQNEGGEEWLSKLDVMKSSTSNVLGAIAILTGLEENLSTSKIANHLCNRLISDIAGASAQSGKTLPLLVLLNATLAVYDEGDLPVAQNRLVFAVKQILSWTENLVATSSQLASEASRALQRLLPAMKDVYGTYWETALTFCISVWNACVNGNLSNDRLPMIGMSLKLFSILRSLKDANEDLEDSLVEFRDLISENLVKLLKLRRSKENQPLKFVDDLLSRLVVNIPSDRIKDLSEFYPLVASGFRIVQSAAYDVLHKALPEVQQQISVDVLLEKRNARLPEELLSLLLDAPSAFNYSDEDLAEFLSPIRGYLLSWHLVFDSYPNASYKVRNDYTEILKSENYVGPLLSFLFDVLGHSVAKPINLDKARFDPSMIRSYNMWQATDSEPTERNMQWLLVNIYYQTLKYTPNLVKTWWVDCKSKQARIAVKSWTEKFFSPLVIQDTLDDVSKWAEEQEPGSDDEKELIVKVSKRSREVFAGYEVDELMMQIAIRLPTNYPLEGVKVDGVNRVAVSEKKWTSWLMITQGVITFSNGSITDGLTIFRKNVTGALKGQTECAICYSIISSDKKMPDKRCQTCKNLFHSSCLFKWFASSNQSTCPLCRNPFNYGTDIARRARERDQAGAAR